jgi:cytochrome c oxidase subunit 2
MRFRIIALDDAAWQTWVANHKQPATQPTGNAATGMDLFFGTGPSNEGGQCIACHTIGLNDQSVLNTAAPNLTHFADPTHPCFAGCDFETFTPDGQCNVPAIEAWLADPSSVKLGAKMPDYNLSDDQITDLTAYLCTLR